MKFILQAAVVFVATVAADYAWTKYMMHAAAKRPHAAGVWSAAIILCGFVSIVSYTENPWLILPALLGAYVGTYLAITRELTDTSELERDQAYTPVTEQAPPARVKELVERWAPFAKDNGHRMTCSCNDCMRG